MNNYNLIRYTNTKRIELEIYCLFRQKLLMNKICINKKFSNGMIFFQSSIYMHKKISSFLTVRSDGTLDNDAVQEYFSQIIQETRNICKNLNSVKSLRVPRKMLQLNNSSFQS